MTQGPFVHREAAIENSPRSEIALSAEGTFAAETLLSALRNESDGAPLGIIAPWARKSGAGWITAPENAPISVLYPVHERTLAFVAQNAYGHEVPYLGILSRRELTDLDIERALGPTRYDPSTTEAVYSTDGGVTPRILFLTWITLHDGVGGGTVSPLVAARALGALLVFPVVLDSQSERELPPIPFETALAFQRASDSAPEEAPVDPQPTGDAPSSATGVNALIWTAALGAAAFVMIGTLRGRT